MASNAEAEEDEYYDEEEDDEVQENEPKANNDQHEFLKLQELNQYSSPALSQNIGQTTAYFNQGSGTSKPAHISGLTQQDSSPSNPSVSLQSESTFHKNLESGESRLQASPSPPVANKRSRLVNQDQIYEYYDEEDDEDFPAG